MKKAVVTGGAGFIGSNLVSALLSDGWEVHSVDNYLAGKIEGRFADGATYHEADVRDTGAMENIFAGVDAVFHTAAVPRVPYSVEHPVETTDHNVTGLVSALTAAARARVRRFVFSSSGSAYGDQQVMPLKEGFEAHPVHPYGLQKYVGEMFAAMWPELYGLQTVSLRYFNVYGPGLDPNGPYALAIGRFLLNRKNGEPITIYGDGTITRDFTHVRDIVRANLLAATSDKVGKGEVINVGAGRSTSINDLAKMFGEGEIVYGPPRVEAHDALADNTKARELLGWTPQETLEDGIMELRKMFGIA